MGNRVDCVKHKEKWIVPTHVAPAYGENFTLFADGQRVTENILWSNETRITPGRPSETITYVTLRDHPDAQRVQISVTR